MSRVESAKHFIKSSASSPSCFSEIYKFLSDTTLRLCDDRSIKSFPDQVTENGWAKPQVTLSKLNKSNVLQCDYFADMFSAKLFLLLIMAKLRSGNVCIHWTGSKVYEDAFQFYVFVIKQIPVTSHGSSYSRIDQVKFVEDSRPYHFKFFKSFLPQILLVHSWIAWPIW